MRCIPSPPSWWTLRAWDEELTRSLDAPSKPITSESKPNAFPSSLRAKRSAVRTLTAEDRKTEATINQTCQACGRPEMRYYTLQLRSADEGTTVFYSCECGHK
jgi:DNA-directed RNA polymerase I subunit RPA12